MFEVIYRLLEMLALVLCLHSLSGEKVKLDIYNVGFIVIELTFMQMIRDEIVSKQLYFAVYLIYFVYAYVKFKDTIQRTILKCMLVIIIIEAVAGSELIKKIVFELNDYKGLNLCVKNAVADISNKDIEKFFEKGYTTKESGRGIGLSKIKEYQKKYNYSIYARLVKQKEIEWLELKIIENM